MDVRSALLQRLQDRILRARAALERFDDVSAEGTRAGPNWNVRDLAGHLLHWTSYFADALASAAAGRAVPPADVDRVNEEVYRKHSRMSFVMLRPKLREAEERLLSVIRAVPPERLADSAERAWVDRAIAHYDHHWPALRTATELLAP